MAESSAAKKSTNPLVMVGVGCLAILVLLGIAGSVAMKFFSKKIGTEMVEKAIENQTGVKTNISDLEKGKMTFTDEKTGQTVEVGSQKVPDNFPKDFPLYPGAKVTSSASGAQAGKSSGFWLSMTSGDAAEKILGFYKTEFAKNGWTVESTVSVNDMTNQTVSKGDTQGSVSVGKGSSDKETQIMIVLGE